MRPYKPPKNPLFKIIYQDDDILVVDKQAGLLSVPGKPLTHRDCLISRVNMVYPSAMIVHRLDMDTSGIMIIPLNRPSLSHIARQFQEKKTQKIYNADIYGTPNEKEGIIDQPLICDWPNRPLQKICLQTGKSSQTHYKILYSDQNKSRVRLTPKTGRSHQLRVHMQHLGHPIIGDQFYADEKAFNMAERLHLHAYQISFIHPTTKEWISFKAPQPF